MILNEYQNNLMDTHEMVGLKVNFTPKVFSSKVHVNVLSRVYNCRFRCYSS